ncbi:MAG: threonylcarbamoyl-AMP synthase [Alphaproteobacteria bacterium]|nr:MAG: threonylcarbamoyl-AMP synthase [Alphaproteobacteria bacterium]
MAVLTPTQDTIAEAAGHLKAGGLVVMPTETVYGLAADATSDRAVASIYELKQRPSFNPLIIHVASLAMAERCGMMDTRARYLARRLWPGPLTLVVAQRPGAGISRLATAGLGTVALRMPEHPVALALIQALDRPVAAPSANRSGRISPTTAQIAAEGLGRSVAYVLDGGACRIGVESTVVDLSTDPACLLRPGAVTRDQLSAAIGELAEPGETIRSPGQLASHYAPGLPLRLDPTEMREGEALLTFGSNASLEGAAAVLNLSPRGSLTEAAANLFACLHALDRPDLYTGIAAVRVPNTGLGIAINDRLQRAAAPRSS